jgi:hypothetical protein
MAPVNNSADDDGLIVTANITGIEKMYIFSNIQSKIF